MTDQDDSERTIRVEDQDPAHWKADGWAARIIKNEDDDGWAVEMTRDGELEPALVGPEMCLTEEPNPLDPIASRPWLEPRTNAHAAQAAAPSQLHRSVTVTAKGGERIRVDLDIVPDEDDPHAMLSVFDEAGAVATRTRVAPDFKLSSASALRWLDRPE